MSAAACAAAADQQLRCDLFYIPTCQPAHTTARLNHHASRAPHSLGEAADAQVAQLAQLADLADLAVVALVAPRV